MVNAAQAFRKYVIPGVPGSGPHFPDKDEIAEALAALEAIIGVQPNGIDDFFPINDAMADSTMVKLLEGTFRTSTTITFDNTTVAFEPDAGPAGELFFGQGSSATTVLGPVGGYAFQIVGGTGVASHIYGDVSGVSFGSPSGGASYGLRMFQCAFISVKDLTFSGLAGGMLLESTLSAEFENITFNSNAIGVSAIKGAGFAQPNALHWKSCRWRLNSTLGYSGGGAHHNVTFEGGSFEGNGTHGVSGTGGVHLNFDGTEGRTGANFHGVYFEGNYGEADVLLNNTAGVPVTHTFLGCNFQRISPTQYTTNFIKALGRHRIVLIGCSFDGYNSYPESSARKYVDYDPALTEVICIGCTFGSSTAQGTLQNQPETFTGRVSGAGTPLTTFPLGWNVSKPGTGETSIEMPFNLGADGYTVNATASDSSLCGPTRVVQFPTYFVVHTTDETGASANRLFNFTVMLNPERFI
ncbi:MAG: hypothetical protein V7704_20595 [Aurantimonas endophytica]|uniref:hypothetical protein n=1 Tax=Aurantimonas endophytica TaxID=1522175 RepID=UPI0030035091